MYKSFKNSSPTSDKKLNKKNTSFVSTRDDSLQRIYKSTKGLDRNFSSKMLSKAKIDVMELGVNEVREKLRVLQRSLPKFPKSSNFVGAHKVREIFRKGKMSESVIRTSGVYLNAFKNKLKQKRFILRNREDSYDAKQSLHEFHSRSKILLNQLEQKVLGDKRTG